MSPHRDDGIAPARARWAHGKAEGCQGKRGAARRCCGGRAEPTRGRVGLAHPAPRSCRTARRLPGESFSSHPAPCALRPAPCTLHSAGLARCKGLFDDSGGLISNLPPSPLTSRHSGTTWTGIVYRDPQPRQPSQVLMTSLTERAWKTRAPSSNADLDYSTLALDEVPLRHGSKRACGSCKSDCMGRGPFTGQSWKACARALNQPFCSCRID